VIFYLIHIVNNHVEGYKELVRERSTPLKQTLMANMAPSYSKYTPIGEMSQVRELRRYDGNPVILLQRPPHAGREQGTYLALKLLAVPTNPDSQMYSMSVHFFNNGTPK
jgi:hypothetical protein